MSEETLSNDQIVKKFCEENGVEAKIDVSKSNGFVTCRAEVTDSSGMTASSVRRYPVGFTKSPVSMALGTAMDTIRSIYPDAERQARCDEWKLQQDKSATQVFLQACEEPADP